MEFRKKLTWFSGFPDVGLSLTLDEMSLANTSPHNKNSDKNPAKSIYLL